MKLQAQRVYDATLALATIIRERRAMPQRGKYLVARMHAKLLPEFNVIEGRRDAMIKAYDTPQTKTEKDEATGEERQVPTDAWQVPADKLEDFAASWKQVCDEELDVDVQPIPLAALCLGEDVDGGIHAQELSILGDLITE